MTRNQRPVLNLQADDVWAASCAAQRINGTYVKFVGEVAEGQKAETNRQIMNNFIANTDLITEADREQGLQVRKFFQAYTFKILKGIKLSEFDNTAMLIANRDIIDSNFDIAVIASLPSVCERGMKRQTVEQRINFANGGYVGVPGDKVSPSIEVLRSVYSQKWNTHYITGITSDDQVLFFAYKQQLEVGKMYDLYGTVKAHRDNTTQLNRVKVIV